ncbi:MAG: recombination protein F [Methanosaeta sp. PtaU1.Bin112]|jgi:putative ATP-dependent endonuclease of OLD family|uniref:AAA family ATPase n=1 Tax=Methanothrix soehngenii TaxID=2223 RepID=A0A7K4AJT0_METSH|nr:AAA family ATPase [Methanothrix sp.]MBP7068239.1 AAA family ATPase [Methanothrix sp.]NLJ23241.1 AAA family ATPase [Methanothrix soehngenii]OPY56121.1 MAG: recombination protein F [Methanosaeta sp. PtaU1.Bin112]
MYLSKIVVNNFRNLKMIEVELSQGLNVIVGENNVGKTNLLDALRAALGSASAFVDPIRLSKDDLYVDQNGQAVKEPIRVDLNFSDLSGDEQAEFLEALEYNQEHPECSTASIHFEWSWSEKTERWHSRRWGGGKSNSEAPVPEDVLQSVPVTLLAALRDAMSALVPGRQSRLGRLLGVSASEDEKIKLQEIIKKANSDLQSNELIKGAEEKIRQALKGASGPDFGQDVQIRSSEPEFERIVKNLRLVLKLRGTAAETGEPAIQELRSNGLGYNNLIYIATVLAELEASANATLPLLLVEEPEAHLHPQLQILLADFLANSKLDKVENRKVQTIVTTHSPTIASRVPTETIRVLHQDAVSGLRCTCLGKCGLSAREANQLRRMLDITRATLLFARGIILVEGISEALLFPVLSKRLSIRLEDKGVSVIPVCGVEFSTISKLFGEDKLNIPISIVTDGDPTIVHDAEIKKTDGSNDMSWRSEIPKKDSNIIEISARVRKLIDSFAQNNVVSVSRSQVTLEYDLAFAGYSNADVICEAWMRCFDGEPRTLNKEALKLCGDDLEKRALTVWRGVCRANSTRGKSELAQQLAELLEEKDETGSYKIHLDDFAVPIYIKDAIDHVIRR